MSDTLISEAAAALRRAAPGCTVILFGSRARQTEHRGSDVDFLVIEPTVTRRRAETVRLQKVLADFPLPLDILVTSRPTFEEWKSVPGTVYYYAATEGRILDDQS